MLKDCNFKLSYSSGYDEPKNFFTEALAESCRFDLCLGFFSSSAIRCLSHGFAFFIANGGKMRVVINHILNPQDKEAIEKGQKHLAEVVENSVLTDIKKLTETLSREDKLFFKCLSYLISIDRIQFVATVSSKGGLGHDKYGIFKDEKGNKVLFTGSANFSKTAIELNGETISVFTQPHDNDRIDEYENMFNEWWQGNTPHLTHIPLEQVKTQITDSFSPETLKELIREGVTLERIDLGYSENSAMETPLSASLLAKLEEKEFEPRFPFPTERDIQINAYQAWLDNNKQGIFAMATGTGKTVTALNCLLKQYKENGFYKAIIVVPTQALAIQWEKEVRNFNFQNIISTHTNKDWKNALSRYTTRCLMDTKKNIVIITTYATFNRKDIQYFLGHTKGVDTFLYIADEAHNLGSSSSLRHLPNMISWRIGLSATPERIYDEIGSSKLYDFFNSQPPKYTFRYTMKQAIENDILCHYDYYPIFVSLNDEEMNQYKSLTRKLLSLLDGDKGKYRDEEQAKKLLLLRKQVIHKAENKKYAIASLLEELKDKKKLDYTFVFVPEGYEHDYSREEAYSIEENDLHIIDEYAQMFKQQGYNYYKFIGGMEESDEVLRNFACGSIQVLLSMKCLDEGVDIPRAENAIFCSSTGNPRQFVQRRGRVLRKSKDKEKAHIWDLIVLPVEGDEDTFNIERNMFTGEVRRILNFAALADNSISVLYGPLKRICDQYEIDLFDMLEEENEQYN